MTSFQQVYEEYARPVYKFLLSLAANEDLAEELLSETFYSALKNIDKFEGRCSMYTWLCQIGKNLWLKECRMNKKIREMGSLVILTDRSEACVEDTFVKEETYRTILEIIRTMDEVYRDVFILHAVGGVKLKEIAAIYEKSESWARVTFYRAKEKLKERMKRGNEL